MIPGLTEVIIFFNTDNIFSNPIKWSPRYKMVVPIYYEKNYRCAAFSGLRNLLWKLNRTNSINLSKGSLSTCILLNLTEEIVIITSFGFSLRTSFLRVIISFLKNNFCFLPKSNFLNSWSKFDLSFFQDFWNSWF